MADVVQAVRVSLDGGRVRVVERLGQHFGGVVAENRPVDVVRLG